MADEKWDTIGKFFDLVKLLVIVALVAAVGVGMFNLDAVLKFSKEAIELMKAAR